MNVDSKMNFKIIGLHTKICTSFGGFTGEGRGLFSYIIEMTKNLKAKKIFRKYGYRKKIV